MATLEDQIAVLAATNGGLASAASALTSEVSEKMGQIDTRMNAAEQSVANFVSTTSFVRKYESSKPSTQDGDGKYHIVRLHDSTDSQQDTFPWISIGAKGWDCSVSCMFARVTEWLGHEGYLGGIWGAILKRGSPDVKFFIAPPTVGGNGGETLVAIRNVRNDSADIDIRVQCSQALSFEFFGALTEAEFPSNWVEVQNMLAPAAFA